jgi:RNA polymerase sigma-70 factor, ECF subfamily
MREFNRSTPNCKIYEHSISFQGSRGNNILEKGVLRLNERISLSYAVSDENLLERAMSGDESAFMLLYERYRTPVFRFVYRMTNSREAAEDATHDCFLSLITGGQRFDPTRASLKTYLFGTARNIALNYLRLTRGETMIEELPEDRLRATGEEILGRLINEERGEAVRRAIENLPALQREALILFEYEGLSLAEIAEIAGAETGTIKARLHRARSNLKRMLAALIEHNRAVAVSEK